MKDTLQIKDDFCDQIEVVRESALAAGFGTFTPRASEMGSAAYEGMGFAGRHDLMIRALSQSLNRAVFPGAMFFRATRPGMEAAYVHSDRMHGDWTCIAYLSKHEEESGTAFFRHRKTGLLELPAPEELKRVNLLDKMNDCMMKGDEKDWEQTDFVRGQYNRALIFHAPLFHARRPRVGLGDGTDETARMCWVAHFKL